MVELVRIFKRAMIYEDAIIFLKLIRNDISEKFCCKQKLLKVLLSRQTGRQN